MTINYIEPKEAFPYKAPTEEVKTKYKELFDLKKPLEVPLPKLIFNKLLSLIILTCCLPIIIFLVLFNWIEGLFILENRDPLTFYYNAVSLDKGYKKIQ